MPNDPFFCLITKLFVLKTDIWSFHAFGKALKLPYRCVGENLRLCDSPTKRLQHRCFPGNIARVLRTAILKNICEQLVLPVLCNKAGGGDTKLLLGQVKLLLSNSKAMAVGFSIIFEF